MIRCRLADLEARCAERGYTLDEAMPCVVERDGDSILVDPSHPAYPRPRDVGLGDWVAKTLGTVGITKERAQRVANALGIEDCGCEKRQEWLNEVGEKMGFSKTTPPTE